MTAPVLRIQGSASGVGRSVLRVAPFKARNMANNAAVTATGGEIGCLAAVLVFAAGVEPTVAMSPSMPNPEADARTPVVSLGRARGSIRPRDDLIATEGRWPVTKADRLVAMLALDGRR